MIAAARLYDFIRTARVPMVPRGTALGTEGPIEE